MVCEPESYYTFAFKENFVGLKKVRKVSKEMKALLNSSESD